MKEKKPYEPPKIIDIKVDYEQAVGQTIGPGACHSGPAASARCQTGGTATGGMCHSGNMAAQRCQTGGSASGGRCDSGGNASSICSSGGNPNI